MKTEVFKKEDLKNASEVLKRGGVLAFPTETVFGLGVIANSEKACKNLIKVKNRRPDKPFTIMCSSISQVENIIEINDLTRKILDKFTPGPITLILKAKKEVEHYLDLGSGFVGVRIPDDETVLKLIDEVGLPLLVPSANPSDLPPARSTKEVLDYFDGKIDGVIEGETNKSNPSTIIKIDENDIILIRKGPISLEQIKGAL